MAQIQGAHSISESGWQTVFDLDFTVEPAQVMAVDGPYVIAGRTWTKRNSVSDAAAMAIKPAGAGLEISPLGDGAFFGESATRTTTAIDIPLTSIAPNVTLDHAIRVWTYWLYDNAAANYDMAITLLGNPGAVPGPASMVTSYCVKRGWAGGLCYAPEMWAAPTLDTVYQPALYASNVTVFTIPCLGALSMTTYAGTMGAGVWPSSSSLLAAAMNSMPSDGLLATRVGTLAQWTLALSAGRGVSATAYKPRVGRVRMDLKL